MFARLLMSAVVMAAAATAAAQERTPVSEADLKAEKEITIAQTREKVAAIAKKLDAEISVADAKMRVPLEGGVVTGAPYSAEVITESVQVLGDGNRIVRRTTGRVYRDGQGRTRREEDREPGHVAVISISDPVAKVAYSLDPDAKSAWKMETAARTYEWKIATASTDPAEMDRRKKLEAEMVAARGRADMTVAIRRAPAWEEKTEKLVAKNIEGVMAQGTRTTRTIPAGAIGNEQPILNVTEEWRSQDLQVLVLTRTSDPRSGESTYRLANIVRADPGQSWFEVPPDYTVRESPLKKVAPRVPKEE